MASDFCRGWWTALLRPGKSCPEEIDAVTGDILDPSTLANAVQGVSAIVHLAAVFRTQDTDLIWKSNLDGFKFRASCKSMVPACRYVPRPQPGFSSQHQDRLPGLAGGHLVVDRRTRWSAVGANCRIRVTSLFRSLLLKGRPIRGTEHIVPGLSPCVCISWGTDDSNLPARGVGDKETPHRSLPRPRIKSVDVSRSLSADVRHDANRDAKPGQGDKGDRKH
ncbi:hypothetical protein ACVIEM_006746 [Rhizobium leguminosarum]